MRCVKLDRQSTFISDMTHFVNGCSRPLNIRQCDKIVVAELWEVLGGEKARWNCTESNVPPGGIGATTLEARKDNSLLVTAFTNSRWRLEACFAPQSPVSLNEDKYQCK